MKIFLNKKDTLNLLFQGQKRIVTATTSKKFRALILPKLKKIKLRRSKINYSLKLVRYPKTYSYLVERREGAFYQLQPLIFKY
jgi:hypothetical protein